METLRREAHSLSGSCAYIAAPSLQAAALSLENAAEEVLGGAPSNDALIADAIERVAEEQRRLLVAIEHKLAPTS